MEINLEELKDFVKTNPYPSFHIINNFMYSGLVLYKVAFEYFTDYEHHHHKIAKDIYNNIYDENVVKTNVDLAYKMYGDKGLEIIFYVMRETIKFYLIKNNPGVVYFIEDILEKNFGFKK
ncbi:MAG: hypothetical protein BGO27_03555 [Alphaproteobacteria bacterium 33-17]|nr:MAG: hypothetical protein BGO27_03555 [Alphaproteobacteria bacterium 33-17]